MAKWKSALFNAGHPRASPATHPCARDPAHSLLTRPTVTARVLKTPAAHFRRAAEAETLLPVGFPGSHASGFGITPAVRCPSLSRPSYTPRRPVQRCERCRQPLALFASGAFHGALADPSTSMPGVADAPSRPPRAATILNRYFFPAVSTGAWSSSVNSSAGCS